jgi:hypothetical protein
MVIAVSYSHIAGFNSKMQQNRMGVFSLKNQNLANEFKGKGNCSKMELLIRRHCIIEQI